eukprot:UN04896
MSVMHHCEELFHTDNSKSSSYWKKLFQTMLT